MTSPEYDYALRDEDTERILAEYDRLSDMYLERALKGEPFDFFHFNVDLNQGPCVIKRIFRVRCRNGICCGFPGR